MLITHTNHVHNGQLLEDDLVECWKIEDKRVKRVSLDEVIENTYYQDSILWGVNPVSPIHLGYDKIFFLLREISRLTSAQVHVLGADVHALLSHGLDLSQMKERSLYYQHYLEEVWNLKHSFTLASEYMFSNEYQTLFLQAISTLKQSVVKDTWNSSQKKSGLLYLYYSPLAQLLDIIYWKPKVIFAEYSQLKIYKIIPEILKSLDMNIETYFIFINQSLSLRGKHLNKSTSKDRISIHETVHSLGQKLANCASFPDVQNNPLLELLEFSVLPFRESYQIEMKFLQGTSYTTITNRQDLRKSIIQGNLVLPECLDLVTGWLEQRIKKTQLTFEYKPELIQWINLDKVRGEK